MARHRTARRQLQPSETNVTIVLIDHGKNHVRGLIGLGRLVTENDSTPFVSIDVATLDA